MNEQEKIVYYAKMNRDIHQIPAWMLFRFTYLDVLHDSGFSRSRDFGIKTA